MVYLFLGKFVWTNGPESFPKVSPYTGFGPWTALPRRGNIWCFLNGVFQTAMGFTVQKGSEKGSQKGF